MYLSLKSLLLNLISINTWLRITYPALDLNCQMKDDGEQRHSVHGRAQREDANIRAFVCLENYKRPPVKKFPDRRQTAPLKGKQKKNRQITDLPSMGQRSKRDSDKRHQE